MTPIPAAAVEAACLSYESAAIAEGYEPVSSRGTYQMRAWMTAALTAALPHLPAPSQPADAVREAIRLLAMETGAEEWELVRDRAEPDSKVLLREALAALESALAQPAAVGAVAPIAWLRMTPEGTPDWAEDCIAGDEHFLDSDMQAEGYWLQPLYTTPPPRDVGEGFVDGHELRRALCLIRVVAGVDGYDVVRRQSVLNIVDRRLTAAQGGEVE